MERNGGGLLAARLAPLAHGLGVQLEPDQMDALARYGELVLDWGARINLTGAKTMVDLAEHLADALALLRWLPMGPFRFLDVGSGAGLPGLVLAMVRPAARGVLLEPRARRQAFLAHAVRELGLGGRVDVRCERFEDHEAAGLYDVAVSRAVWPVAEWLERGRPLVKAPGGRVLGLEGQVGMDILPSGVERHPYRLGRRRRAVLVLAS